MAPEALFLTIQDAYHSWGLPKDSIERTSYTTPEHFRDMLAAISPKIPQTPCRLIPSSFSPDDPNLSGVPRPITWRWTSCADALRTFHSRGVMMRAPLFFQIEQTLFLACKEAGAFIFVNDQGNMPLGAAALERAEIDTVVTTTEDAANFYAYCSEKKSKLPPRWILIEDAAAAQRSLPSDLENENVAREIHLFPGMPILVQCEHLIRAHSTLFHVDASYLLEIDPTHGALITSNTEEIFPLFRYQLPISLTEGTSCACGKTTVEIKN